MQLFPIETFCSLLFCSHLCNITSYPQGCLHMKWNCPCCLYQDVPLSVLWPQSGKDNPSFFFLCFPLIPSTSHERLVSKQAQGCGAQLFDRALWRAPHSGLEALGGIEFRIWYGSCPMRWSSVGPSVCHLAYYHAPLFLPDAKQSKQCAALDK